MPKHNEEKLISKKELLQKYDISYGALYRWKRKGLIPDEWFIKKATITGQETFFPEQLILPRMESILQLKDEFSLDELSVRFSGQGSRWSVVISTRYGDKTFPLEDIKSVSLRRADGECTDIFDMIKTQIKEDK